MGILSIRNRFGLASLGVQVHSRGKSHPAGAAETGTWAGTWDTENASCRHVGVLYTTASQKMIVASQKNDVASQKEAI